MGTYDNLNCTEASYSGTSTLFYFTYYLMLSENLCLEGHAVLTLPLCLFTNKNRDTLPHEHTK